MMTRHFRTHSHVILWIVCMAIACHSASGQIFIRRVWHSFDTQMPAGSPVTLTVKTASPTNTIMEIHVPGVWLSTHTVGNSNYTRVEYPATVMSGLGYSESEPWFDFPTRTKQLPLPRKRYQYAPAITVPKPVFPPAARGQTIQTIADMRRWGIDPVGARPGIPALRGMLAVSGNNRSEDVHVNQQQILSTTLTLSHPLAPAGYDAYDQVSGENGFTAPTLIDADFYRNYQGAYSGVEAPVTSVRKMGAYSTVEMRTPLFEMVNATNISFHTNLVLEVTHLQGTEDFDCPISWDSWMFNIPFMNGEALRSAMTAKGLAIEASRSAHYLILTPRSFRSTLDEFALWKQNKGLNVDFAYVGSDSVLDDVAADRNAIDAYIETFFKINYCHGLYVLLVGDVDIIPAGRSSHIGADPDGATADSDHVYAVIGDDIFSSVYVGRLPCHNTAELQVQLDKILSYERDPVGGNWPTMATLAANSQNDDETAYVSSSFPSKYAAAVNAIANYGGYTSPPTFEVLHAGAANYTVTRAVNQDVVDAVNQGRGQVLYRGHGSGTGWVAGWDGNGTAFTASIHLPLLHNGVFPIIYSIACQNGRLRDPGCIGREWMLHDDGGAVAHWGATVNSNTDENHNRAKGIFRAIYESGFTRLGPALAEAERISYALTGGGDGWLNNTFCYMLLGDPEMTIRKESIPLQINLPSTRVISDPDLTRIEVRDGSGNLMPGAFVNLVLADGTRTNGFTGTNGQLELPGIKTNNISRFILLSDAFKSRQIIFNPLKRGMTLESLGYDAKTGFSFKFATVPLKTYLIQGSPDLETWYDLKSTNAAGNVVVYVDPPSILSLRTLNTNLLPIRDTTIGTIIRTPIVTRARNHYFRVIQE